MTPVRNPRHLFNEIPKDYPVPGKTTVNDTSQTIDLENVPLNGGFLLKTLVLSVDPYQRGRMRDPSIKSYGPAFTVGEPIDNYGVAVVIRSEHPNLQVGDHIYGFLEYVEYQIKTDPNAFKKLANEERIPWSLYAGVAGMPGKTAYAGWAKYSSANKGEIVFVSGGAGVVGSFVVQLAKQDGLKVIASAGSDAKVNFVKSLGADVAFNYKTTFTGNNVGGETLAAALDAANMNARFIICGMISAYNKGSGVGIRNMIQIYARQISMFGFLVALMESKYTDSFYEEVPRMLARGELKYNEHIYRGLESVGQALLDIQTGANEGKSVVIVADE